MGTLKALVGHLLVWTTYVAFATIAYGYGANDWPGYTYETITSHLISAVVFYATALYAFPNFLDKKKYSFFVFSLVGILGISILLRYFFAFIIYPKILGRTASIAGFRNDYLLVRFSFQWFTFSLYAAGYWQAVKRLKTERKLKGEIIEEAKQQKLELEIAALRAQINPHFIFNSLDLFRIQTEKTLPTVSRGIGSFMHIIRAGISNPDPDGMVPIELELDAIEGTIFIFRQRFPDISLSHISHIKDEDKIRIFPHILLPIVENTFKHGVYDDKQKKLKIELYVDRRQIRLETYNKKSTRIKDQSTGIGLAYIRKLLEQEYKGRHQLVINETVEDYTVELSIELS